MNHCILNKTTDTTMCCDDGERVFPTMQEALEVLADLENESPEQEMVICTLIPR